VIAAMPTAPGKKVMFAFNVTGEIDEMRRRHDLVLELGGTCIMASLNSGRLVRLIALRPRACCRSTPTATAGATSQPPPMLGWSYIAWQKLWRLAGADHMHVNGLATSSASPTTASSPRPRACLTPMFAGKPCIAMPVFSSGQSVRQAPRPTGRWARTDLIYAAGGGIMAHPHGHRGRRAQPAPGLGCRRRAADT
jgi:ribulose-bisphosphate carboxylase large chain